MKLTGYGAAPASVQLTGEQQEWFKEQEEKLGHEIEIIYGGLKQMVRPDDFDETKIINIYDQATSAPPVQGQQAQLGVEYLELCDVRDLEKPPNQQRTYAFSMRQRNGARRLNDEHMLYAPFRPAKAGPTDPQTLFELWKGTMWSRYCLSNFKRFNEGPDIFRDTKKTMDYIFGPVLKKLTETGSFKSFSDERQAAVRTMFLDQAQKHASQRGTQLLSEVGQLEKAVISHDAQRLAASRSMHEKQHEYDYIIQSKGLDENQLLNEYNELCKNTRLKKMEYDPQRSELKIYTNLLYLYSPDRMVRTPAGEFRIHLNLDMNSITIYNLTNQCGGRHHPHVPGDGNPCWGSAHTMIHTALEHKELIPCFETIVEYLESYNAEDTWGRWAANWWIPQEETEQQELQEDGIWLTKPEIAALAEKAKETGKEPSIDDALTAALTAEPNAAAEIEAQITT